MKCGKFSASKELSIGMKLFSHGNGMTIKAVMKAIKTV
jgi:hypothetical protein